MYVEAVGPCDKH